MATVLCLLLMLELGPESLPMKFGILTVSPLILGWIIKTPLLHKATVYLQNHTKKVEFNLWPQLPQTEKTPKCTRGENSWVFAPGQPSPGSAQGVLPVSTSPYYSKPGLFLHMVSVLLKTWGHQTRALIHCTSGNQQAELHSPLNEKQLPSLSPR